MMMQNAKNNCFFMTVCCALTLSACQTVPTHPEPVSPVVIIDENMDDDNDGVPENRDQCPNTPLNVVVDELGCPIPLIMDSEPLREFRLFFPKNQSYPFDSYQSQTQNSEVIRQNMLDALAEPLNYLKTHPDKSLCLSIEGHASTGKYGDTIKHIDLQRALTTKQMFKEWVGIDEKNINVNAFSSERPIADNKTFEGVKMNQRVYVQWYGCPSTK